MKTLDTYTEILTKHRPVMPRTKEEHESAVALLEALAMNEDEQPEEVERFIELLMTLVLAYEEKAAPIRKASGVEVLQSLMEERGLRQADLVPGLGTKAYVSQIVNGQRSINRMTAERLGAYFKVNPQVFQDDSAPFDQARKEVSKVLDRERKRKANDPYICFELADLTRTFLLTQSQIEDALVEMHREKGLQLIRRDNIEGRDRTFEEWDSTQQFFEDPRGEGIIKIRYKPTAAAGKQIY